MKKLLLCVLLLVAGASAGMAGSWADHHGRGKEPTDGFPGVYESGRVMATFTGDGHIILVHTDSNVAVSVHSYIYTKEADLESLVIQDVSPPAFYGEELAACTRDNAGTYRIERLGQTFKVIAVEEPCKRRGELWAMLTLSPYARKSSDNQED